MNKKDNVIKSNIIHGFGTLIMRELFIKLISFLGQIILARLFVPSDFGIYVIIVFIVNFFSLFSDIGLSIAIIQKKEEPSHQELSGIFLLKLLLSLALVVLIWVFAPYIKFFYPMFTEVNVSMLKIFSATLILTSIRLIPISLLERKIKYSLISFMDIIGVTTYYIFAVGGALLNFGVWSFIVGVIIKEIVETIFITFMQPFFPTFNITRGDIKKMVKFGIYVQGNSLVMFAISSITPVLGGRLSGSHAVGLLDFAYSLASLPNIISMNFSRVAFTGYSRIQGNKDILIKSVSKSISMLAIILYIFPVIFFSFAGELVQYIYTDKWITAVPSLLWFSAAVVFYPLLSPLGQVILSIGKSKEIFWTTFIIAVVGWIGSVLFIHAFSFVGIAIIYFFICALLCISYILILKKASFEFPIVSIIFPKIAASIFAIAFSLVLNISLPSSIVTLIAKFSLSIIAYIVFMFIFVKQDTLELFKLLLRLIPLKHI